MSIVTFAATSVIFAILLVFVCDRFDGYEYMSINPFASPFFKLPPMPSKRKIFVSYHHKNDQWYYNEFSRKFHDYYGLVYDNSLDRLIESDNCEYVMRKIREDFLTGTSCTVVLCGPETRGRKYVDWEIKATLDKQHGLLGIILPNNPITPTGTSKPDRLQDNVDSGFASIAIWEHIVNDPAYLGQLIEKVVNAPKWQINNSREVRRRNAPELIPQLRQSSLLGEQSASSPLSLFAAPKLSLIPRTGRFSLLGD